MLLIAINRQIFLDIHCTMLALAFSAWQAPAARPAVRSDYGIFEMKPQMQTTAYDFLNRTSDVDFYISVVANGDKPVVISGDSLHESIKKYPNIKPILEKMIFAKSERLGGIVFPLINTIQPDVVVTIKSGTILSRSVCRWKASSNGYHIISGLEDFARNRYVDFREIEMIIENKFGIPNKMYALSKVDWAIKEDECERVVELVKSFNLPIYFKIIKNGKPIFFALECHSGMVFRTSEEAVARAVVISGGLRNRISPNDFGNSIRLVNSLKCEVSDIPDLLKYAEVSGISEDFEINSAGEAEDAYFDCGDATTVGYDGKTWGVYLIKRYPGNSFEPADVEYMEIDLRDESGSQVCFDTPGEAFIFAAAINLSYSFGFSSDNPLLNIEFIKPQTSPFTFGLPQP